MTLTGLFTVFIISEIKVEIKKEDESESTEQEVPKAEQEVPEPEQEHGQDSSGQAEQVKVEADKRGDQYSRKRPYEESRGYGYYEHREDKR